MLTYEEIMNYCSNYKIENGIVIDKKTASQIKDEEIILKVKASILVYKEAKENYQSDMQQFGKSKRDQEYYVKKTMEKFSVNNEENTYGINKLINAILSSNGHYEENMSGSDLQNSKFSILVEPKKEYGFAYLKLKFREKGLDIEDLKISQNLEELQQNGISKVIIDFKIKKYKKDISDSKTIDSIDYQHPRATELNELEKEKQIAKQNNDKVAYNNAQSAIEKIIRESPAEVTPEEWDSMNLSQQISFVKVKINESKILHDEDAFNYWNSNLKSLEKKLGEHSEVKEASQPSSSSEKEETSNQNSSNKNQYQEMLEELEEKDYKYYFDEMIKAIKKYHPEQNITEEQKKQIIGEIFYNEGYMIEKLSNDEEIRQLMTLVVNNLGNSELETRLSNIILAEMQEKYKKLHPENQKQEESKEDKNMNNSNNDSDNLDLSSLIEQLNKELEKIKNHYNAMLTDRNIDDEELTVLTNMINRAIDDGYSLKSLATDQNDIRMISSIINTLEEEQNKMNKTKNTIEETSRGMK